MSLNKTVLLPVFRYNFLIYLLLIAFSVAAQPCTVRNFSWQSGEQINYHVYYTLAGIYMYGGEANFTVRQHKYNNRPAFYIRGDGKTNSFFDGIFKVRDRYESYIDSLTLLPYKFIRNIEEGSFKKFETITFNPNTNTAITKKATYTVPPCVQDVLSAIYYCRNLDFAKYKPGDKIPFSMFIDEKVYELYIRYLGKEVIKTRYGKFKAIKFKPLLIEGTIFKGGEEMVVWVTDDLNRIPVRIESPISVGSVKVDMMGYLGLRHPLISLISRR